ncbi:MltA domain-containing protein, partial [bacterium]|nr:MltA domain-containing protein [bacterium]
MDRIGKIVALVLSAIILFAAPALAWQEIPELPFDERGDKAGLLLALDRQAEYLARLGDRPVKVGALRVPASKLAAGVTTLRKIVDESFGKPDLSERVNAAFRIFRTSHPAKPGRAHLTGYYDPIVEASHTRSGPYIHPLYARPPDLE